MLSLLGFGALTSRILPHQDPRFGVLLRCTFFAKTPCRTFLLTVPQLCVRVLKVEGKNINSQTVEWADTSWLQFPKCLGIILLFTLLDIYTSLFYNTSVAYILNFQSPFPIFCVYFLVAYISLMPVVKKQITNQ